MTAPTHYDGYYDHAGQWLAIAPDWADIREAPRNRVFRVLDRGEPRMARWGTHPVTGKQGWLSVIDDHLMLDPTHFRDLARPPDAA